MSLDAYHAIAAMHAAYCRESGMTGILDPSRERMWFEVYKRGIRAPDVVDLIRWMKWKQKNQKPCRSLTFRNFVGSADFMEEDLAELRSRRRSAPAKAAQETDRASVLRSSGRPAAPEPPPGRPAAAVMTSFFDGLRKTIEEESK
ncbi:MAG: hypothetical protein J0L84_02120 [Verrucomicrobia bacterium]|nr:hypothetical protein [Verrucomicrobiota bacterium]